LEPITYPANSDLSTDQQLNLIAFDAGNESLGNPEKINQNTKEQFCSEHMIILM
jgi:hypothetical protein